MGQRRMVRDVQTSLDADVRTPLPLGVRLSTMEKSYFEITSICSRIPMRNEVREGQKM